MRMAIHVFRVCFGTLISERYCREVNTSTKFVSAACNYLRLDRKDTTKQKWKRLLLLKNTTMQLFV